MTGIITILIPLALAASQPPVSTAQVQSDQNQLTKAEKAHGFKLLFDGKTTDGWTGFRKDHVPSGWTVKDGDLVFTPGAEGGDIMTTGEYGDFELRLQWKISEGGNSGIIYRVTDKDDATWLSGPEMQVLDDARHSDGKNPMTSAGSAYAMYAPSKKVVKPANEWNAVRIICKGNHVEHWLNGVKIVSYEIGSADWKERVAKSKFKDAPDYGMMKQGHIALQDHGNLVSYRDIRIKKL